MIMEKKKGTARAKSRQHSKDAAVKELRLNLSDYTGRDTPKGKAVSLVSRILSPSNTEDAARSLMNLMDALCNTKKRQDRIEITLYCQLQSVLYCEDWDVYLKQFIDRVKSPKAKRAPKT
ncbi:MAG: hypothetical protein ACR2LC_14905 [Pyrinomonadaceae bacterium]